MSKEGAISSVQVRGRVFVWPLVWFSRLKKRLEEETNIWPFIREIEKRKIVIGEKERGLRFTGKEKRVKSLVFACCHLWFGGNPRLPFASFYAYLASWRLYLLSVIFTNERIILGYWL